MSGMEYLLRHIKRLPEEQMKALLSMINGEPYDAWQAREGARTLWARNVVPATGLLD